jgi:hypothetical protein
LKAGRNTTSTRWLSALCLFCLLCSFPLRAQAPLQWRIGFDLGNAIVLETPELNPGGDPALAIRDARRVLPQSPPSVGLALLPFSQVAMRNEQLTNPREWTVLNLSGTVTRKTFRALGVFLGSRMTSAEGGYHLVSVPAMPTEPFLGIRREPAPDALIFGFAGPIKGKPQIHTKRSETKWENLLPLEDPAQLPAGYEAAKQLLDDHNADAGRRFLYGTSIEALVRKRLNTLWLLNYSHPDTAIGNHPWGVFISEANTLKPLYVYNPANSAGDPFVAYFAAAVDLDQDGTDELVVEASYRIGTAYKVISAAGGDYREIHTSYYRGPE